MRDVPLRPERLALRRRMLGLSQSDLAEAAGISQATLSKIEQGLREPTPEHVGKIALALNCPDTFFFQSEREYGPPMSAHPMFTAPFQAFLIRVSISASCLRFARTPEAASASVAIRIQS